MNFMPAGIAKFRTHTHTHIYMYRSIGKGAN